jgi:hypothetical protein
MRHAALFVALALSGCTPLPDDKFKGYDPSDFFTFDPDYRWEYVSTDTELKYALYGQINPELEESVDDGATKIRTFEFFKNCVGNDPTCVEDEFVRSFQISVNSLFGTYLWGSAAGADATDFDPEVAITGRYSKKGDVVETETGGKTWTSTMRTIEACPVQWNVEWPTCLVYDVDDGDGDLKAGDPMSGTWWMVAGYALVAFDLAGETGRWELQDHDKRD